MTSPTSQAPVRRPDFLILGAQKAGTTALATFLGAHPQLHLPPAKELHVFDDPVILGSEYDEALIDALYARRMPALPAGGLVGEATPIYLFLPDVPARLQRYNPAMKLIVLLRDPVDRAISHHAMERARGCEGLPLPLALLAEPWRLARDPAPHAHGSALRRHSYLARGRYQEQVERIYRYFPAHQVLLLRSEALAVDHAGTLRRTFRFLGVADDVPLPEAERVFPGEYRVGWTTRWILRMIYRRQRRWMASLSIPDGSRGG